MKAPTPIPEEARKEYHRSREYEISQIRRSYFRFSGSSAGMVGCSRARVLLRNVAKLENTVLFILEHKDEIYIPKQMMDNLLHDKTWLAKLRLEATSFLNKNNDTSKKDIPGPEEARREYWKIRERERSSIKSSLWVMGSGGGIWANHNARSVLHSLKLLKKLVHIILANKDKIFISKLIMENLPEDAAWLEKVEAEADRIPAE